MLLVTQLEARRDVSATGADLEQATGFDWRPWLISLAAVPSCWVKVGVLKTVVAGVGTRLLGAWRPALVVLPRSLRDGAERRLDGLIRPAAAHMFEIPAAGCASEDVFSGRSR